MSHKIYTNQKQERVPSVTTIISNNLGWNKQMLMAWSKKIALTEGRDSDEIKDEAANIGTIAHYLIECKIKKEIPDISQYKKEDLLLARNGYLAFCQWEDWWKPDEYIHSELELVSNNHNYGGTIDLIVRKDNALHILDIKTSNHVHPEMAIQLAAYKQMYEEVNNQKIESCNIIKVNKNKVSYNFYPISPKQIEAGWHVFESMLTVDKNREILKKFGKE